MTRYDRKRPPPGARRRFTPGRVVPIEPPQFERCSEGVLWWRGGRHGLLIGAGPGQPCPCGERAAAWYVCGLCRALFFGVAGPLVRVERERDRTLERRHSGRSWTVPDEQRLSVER